MIGLAIQRKSRRQRRGRIAEKLSLVAIALFLAAALSGQKMEINAPVEDFRLPAFSENGYKKWELRGEVGRRLETMLIAVTGMELRIYSGDETMTLENTIYSPEAMIDHDAGEAWGTDYLKIEGAGFSVMGRDWHWYGAEDRIVVEEDVRVRFREDVGDILK